MRIKEILNRVQAKGHYGKGNLKMSRIKPWSMMNKKASKREQLQSLKDREKAGNYLIAIASGKTPQEAMKELEKHGRPRWMTDHTKETEKNYKRCKNCNHPRNDHRINVEKFKDSCNVIVISETERKQCTCGMYLSPEK